MAIEIENTNSARNGEHLVVPLYQVHTGNLNPRTVIDWDYIENLASSIKAKGLLEALVVREFKPGRWFIEQGRLNGTDGFFLHDAVFLDESKPQFEQYDPDGPSIFYTTREEAEEKTPRYEIIAGECRWRACNKAGLLTVDVKLIDCPDDDEAEELALIENLSRKDIDVVDEAKGLRRLVEKGKSVTELAKTLNRAQPTISNLIRLVDNLPDNVLEIIRRGEITPSHGKALITWADYPHIFEVLLQEAKDGATTKSLEKLDGHQSLLSKKAICHISNYDFGNNRVPECCSECEHRRGKGTSWSDYCLDVPCYNKLVKDSKREAKDALRVKAMEEHSDLVTRDTRSIDQVKDWKNMDSDEDLEAMGCQNDCESLEIVLSSNGRPMRVCTNTECYKAKQEQLQEKKQQVFEERCTQVRSEFLCIVDGPEDVRDAMFRRLVATRIMSDIDNNRTADLNKDLAGKYGLSDLDWDWISAYNYQAPIKALKLQALASQPLEKLLMFWADRASITTAYGQYHRQLETTFQLIGLVYIHECPQCNKEFDLKLGECVVSENNVFCSQQCFQEAKAAVEEQRRKQEELCGADSILKDLKWTCPKCAHIHELTQEMLECYKADQEYDGEENDLLCLECEGDCDGEEYLLRIVESGCTGNCRTCNDECQSRQELPDDLEEEADTVPEDQGEDDVTEEPDTQDNDQTVPDGVDLTKASWIFNNSVGDINSKNAIESADLATLKYALEQEKSNRQRGSLIATLERKIRKAEKQESAQ